MVNVPRIILAALSGGSGKTIVSIGLCAHFRERGLRVHPFKKGPDYIDAAWMSLASNHPVSNLDPFLMDGAQVEALFWSKAAGADLALIEGNRGLFDGKDVQGSCSTAELARMLQAPILLVVDCTKMTRTVAALVQGCREFEPDLTLAGVVFNQTAGERHRAILTRSVETYTDVPVLGALPKLAPNPIPERHMGLISSEELEGESVLSSLSRVMGEWLDTEGIAAAARRARPVMAHGRLEWPEPTPGERVRIGYVRDVALWFYYEENIEALEHAGAEVVQLSLLQDKDWPEIHGLYLGGGFPETMAPALAANERIRSHVRRQAALGLPIYAECGGLMYLGRSIRCGGTEHPMAGVFSFTADLCARPQGHGYTRAEVILDNPFHEKGALLQGHEFHYSQLLPEEEQRFALRMHRGHGIDRRLDGLVVDNVFATYTHIHALGVPGWAGRFVAAARSYRHHRMMSEVRCPRLSAGGDTVQQP
jgi:cobyrinic acid a,c-diamide synthase